MSKHFKPNDKKEELELKLIGEVDRDLSWTFIVLISILPLLVRAKVIDFIAPLIIAQPINTGLQVDCFTYYKWVFLLAITVIAVMLLLYKILAYHYEIRASYINIPILLLLLFILLSLVTADHKSIALVGLFNQREGAVAYLCYLLLLFAAANTNFEKGLHKYITIALGIFTCINLVIILFNFFGHDLMSYPLVLSLMFPSTLQQYAQGNLNSTLSNPDYVSGLAAALFSFFVVFAILQDKWKQSLVYILLSLASFAIMLASLAASGFVSLLIVSPVIIALAFLGRERKKMLAAVGLTLILCLAIFMAMNAYNPGVYKETLGVIKQAFLSSVKVPEAVAAENDTNVTGSGNEQSDCFKLPVPGYSAGTGRIYIWEQTLQLIMERPLTGYGLDTLAYYFPQNDINKIAGIGSYDTLITKPHNMYLGLAYGAGIPALLILLILFLLHFYYTGKYLIKAEHDKTVILPAALFAFFCTFLIQWLFNDSVIDSSAIFWVMLGAAVSLNAQWLSRQSA